MSRRSPATAGAKADRNPFSSPFSFTGKGKSRLTITGDDYGGRWKGPLHRRASPFALRATEDKPSTPRDGISRAWQREREREGERAATVPESASVRFSMLCEWLTNHLPMVSLLLSFPFDEATIRPTARFVHWLLFGGSAAKRGEI